MSMRTCSHCGESFPDEAVHCPNDGSSLVPDEERGDLAGRVLDQRYFLEERIGAGGLGEVYRGRHIKMGRACAVKLLHTVLTASPEFVRRFDREAHALSRLQHPFCVTVTDYGHSEHGPYIVMELVEGTPLSHYTRGEGLPLGDAVDIMMKVLAGLDHAHGQGIIHRDVKPDNIMLIADPRHPTTRIPKILDFGIAKFRAGWAPSAKTPLTQAGVLVGTPAYMAPEQASVARIDSIDAAVDQYSVGVILFELCCGRRPFPGPTPVSLLHQHRHEAPPAPSSLRPSLPAALDAVVLRALEKEPRDRFASAGAFREALAALLPLDPALAAEPPPASAPAMEPVLGTDSTIGATPRSTPGAEEVGPEEAHGEDDDRRGEARAGEPPLAVGEEDRPAADRPGGRHLAAALVVLVLALGGSALWWALSGDAPETASEPAAGTDPRPAGSAGTGKRASDRPRAGAWGLGDDATERDADGSETAAAEAGEDPAGGETAVPESVDPEVAPGAPTVPPAPVARYAPPAELAATARRWMRATAGGRGDATRAMLRYLSHHADDAPAHLYVARLFLRALWIADGLKLLERAAGAEPALVFDLETVAALGYAYRARSRGRARKLVAAHASPALAGTGLLIAAAAVPDADVRTALRTEVSKAGGPRSGLDRRLMELSEKKTCKERRVALAAFDDLAGADAEVRVLLDHLRDSKCLGADARHRLR